FLHLGNRADALMRKNGILERPNSLADPATIDSMKKLLEANIGSAKGSSVVAYAYDDEISTGSFCSPLETDGSPKSVAGYRKFLEGLYGDIARLNAQHGTSYKSFEEISPKSYDGVREQLTPENLGRVNLSAWCDFRSYMDTQFAKVLSELTAYANSLDPATPA